MYQPGPGAKPRAREPARSMVSNVVSSSDALTTIFVNKVVLLRLSFLFENQMYKVDF